MRIFIFLILILGNCFAGYAYADDKPFQQENKTSVLKAKNIEVISDYISDNPKNIDTILPKPVKYEVKENLENTYFVDGTGSNKVLFTIKEASITRDIEKAKGMFDNDVFKYTGRLAVEIKVLDENGKILARSLMKSWGARKISGSTSIAEREKAIKEMINKLLEGLNKQIADELNKGLSEYVAQP